jgi:hypothetical protein
MKETSLRGFIKSLGFYKDATVYNQLDVLGLNRMNKIPGRRAHSVKIDARSEQHSIFDLELQILVVIASCPNRIINKLKLCTATVL